MTFGTTGIRFEAEPALTPQNVNRRKFYAGREKVEDVMMPDITTASGRDTGFYEGHGARVSFGELGFLREGEREGRRQVIGCAAE